MRLDARTYQCDFCRKVEELPGDNDPGKCLASEVTGVAVHICYPCIKLAKQTVDEDGQLDYVVNVESYWPW